MDSRFRRRICHALIDEKSESFAVFTDPLARLTTYHHRDESTVLISRECKFIQTLKKRPAFDRIGWAELLCLNHLLGRRTLFENIESAPTGMLYTCRREGGDLKTSLTSLYTTNLDEKDAPGKSTKNYAAELVDLWMDKCRTWGTCAGTTKNVVSLSGGKDSRVVAGVLTKLGIPFVAATFNDAYGVANPDVVASEALAKAMNMDWRLFLLEKPTDRQNEFLVQTTDGINPVANAAVIPFLEIIVKEWGRGVKCTSGGWRRLHLSRSKAGRACQDDRRCHPGLLRLQPGCHAAGRSGRNHGPDAWYTCRGIAFAAPVLSGTRRDAKGDSLQRLRARPKLGL
ncbi:MAG: hypothetical protein IPK83_04405 [Planctomycetes bacterium]|nr:hypothetical protein [Planctomycetota bacterium]